MTKDEFIEEDGVQYPSLAAYTVPNSISYVIWCKYCHKWHSHGTGGDSQETLAANLTHRVAHCLDFDNRGRSINSPYQETGYLLRYAGPATPEILKDLRRARQKGPILESALEARQ